MTPRTTEPKSCMSCTWCLEHLSVLFCRRYPPQNYGGPVQGENGQPALIFAASYPGVNPDVPCGEHKRGANNLTHDVQ